jgi:hypothetical protein
MLEIKQKALHMLDKLFATKPPPPHTHSPFEAAEELFPSCVYKMSLLPTSSLVSVSSSTLLWELSCNCSI